MGDGNSQREGLPGTEPQRIGSMMAAPRGSNLVLISSQWQEAFVIIGFGGLGGRAWAVGWVNKNAMRVLLCSFSFSYDLIPGVWHFQSDKSF